ncbi:MAG: serine hydroxymethyltransferase, partial [Rhodospirillaceae bacterium]|nr:serine hydroxymethyltransferase [Rhodospirillaceae bacterium]
KLNSGVFPGVQGSVILNAVAAKAVCLGEALRPEFKDYALAVLTNARALAATLMDNGIDVVTGGTDTPLMLVDLRNLGLTGAEASESLERAGLTCNKNGVPGDTQPPTVTSGLRFGVSAGTTRGFRTAEFEAVGVMIADVLNGLAKGKSDMPALEAATARQVTALTANFPIYEKG